MSVWKRIQAAPDGVLPDGLLTKVAIVAAAVVIAALVLTTRLTGPGEDAAPEIEAPEAASASLQQRVQAAIATEARRAAEAEGAARLAAANALAVQEAADSAFGITGPLDAIEPLQAGLGGLGPAGPLPGDIPPGGGFPARTEAEAVLMETLRLEDIERRTRSLRTEPLVLTYRAAGSGDPAAAPPPPPPAMPAPGQAGAQGLDGSIAAAGDFLSRLAELDAAGPGLPAVPALPVLEQAAAAAAGSLIGAEAGPVTVEVPDVAEDWDRITEGSFLEAVLVTQLSGDFPGPVLAQVSVPFYSADRQRILIPRGARVVGTASGVVDRDQSRLAVGFHRLLWPDGRSVRLAFEGLNQSGEAALRDEVDRHYFSTFVAAGAVGILAGLTARGSDPYAGGRAGVQAGASQGLGQSATQILDRFLNRLPTITIRAGHRLRIWFTNDVRIPPSGVEVTP